MLYALIKKRQKSWQTFIRFNLGFSSTLDENVSKASLAGGNLMTYIEILRIYPKKIDTFAKIRNNVDSPKLKAT